MRMRCQRRKHDLPNGSSPFLEPALPHRRSVFLAAIAALFFASMGCAVAESPDSPRADNHTYAQNFRHMVLATCIANAYTGDKQAAIDAGSSVSALRDWAY